MKEIINQIAIIEIYALLQLCILLKMVIQKKKEKRKSKYKYVKMTKNNKGALTRIYGDCANDSTATFQIGNKQISI